MAAVSSRMFGDAQPVTVGRFEITGRLGAGGMGTVYEAVDPQLGRAVAVKLLRSPTPGRVDDAARQRMLREGRALAQLSHPNVVTVFESGVAGDDVYVAMELVDGGDLQRWLREHPPGSPDHTRRALDLIVQAGRGLVAAHRAGLVHRDFKPSNVVVGRDGRARIADFGLVRPQGGALDSASDASRAISTTHDADSAVGSDASLTRTGAVLGTLAYMSPEQLDGMAADERSDQFSFCVTAWELLTGQRPFRGATPEALALAIDDGAIARPSGRVLPAWLERILRRGLASDPMARHPDVQGIVDAIERQLRRRQRIIALGVATTLAFGGGLALREFATEDEDPCTAPEADVWAGQQETIANRFEAVDRDFSRRSYGQMSDALSRWAAAWSEAHVQACRATRVRGEQSDEALDLRVACLRRLMSRAQAPARILGGEDGVKRLRETEELLGGLPDVAACQDVQMLRRYRSTDDPQRRDQLQLLRGQLAVAAALHGIRDYAGTHQTVDAVLPQIRELEAPEVFAEALELELRYPCTDGAGEACRAQVQAALDAASAADRRDLEARVWARWGTELAREHERLDAAEVAYQAAYRAASASDEPELMRAWVLVDHGYVTHVFAQQPAAAIELIDESIAIIEAREGEQSPRLLRPLTQIAQPLRGSAQHERALQVTLRAHALATELHGEHNTLVNDLQREIGQATANLGRVDEALVWLRRSLASDLELLGPDATQTAESQSLIAQLLQEQQDWTGSLVLFASALHTYEQSAPKLIPGLLGLRARSFGELDRHAEAMADLDRAVSLAIELFGDDHFAVEQAVGDRANYWAARKDFARALVDHQASLEIAERRSPPDDPYLAGHLRRIGADHLALDQVEPAIIAFERALPLTPKDKPRGSSRARSLMGLGEALARRGNVSDRVRARSLIAQARADAEAMSDAFRGAILERCDSLLADL